MNRKQKRRPGFTLVELLVVMAIIGVLVSLLLPAVQAAREAARRTSCQSRLTQFILAVHNYEMSHGVYPPGTINPKGPIRNVPAGYHHSWTIQILPYIEEQNTWKAIDKSVGVYTAKNAAAVTAMPRIFTCPSSSAGGNICYAGVHHDQEKPIDANDNGVFFLNSRLRYDDITDGSTHTLFLGEKPPDGWDLHWMSGTRATLRNTGSPLNAMTRTTGLPAASDYKDWTPPADDGAAPETSPPGDAVADAAAAPSAPKTPAAPGTPLYVGGFSSQHAGGVQFAFGDGHVQFLSSFMSATVLSQLANRKDGQLTPEY
jgi:prepilin-type N-terminal cleavage/methylation domain-containing protein/prepilin-type processing-associated H-X9-DG protein